MEENLETTIILAGGEGKRLRPFTENSPKPMITLFDKPLIEYIIHLSEKNGIKKIILSVGYKAEKIIEYFNKKKNEFSSKIEYSVENTPLGTGGAIKLALSKCTDKTDVLVINGDSIFFVDFKKMYEFHKKNNALITIGVTMVSDISKSGAIKTSGSLITDFIEKPMIKKSGMINAGIYLINLRILNKLPKTDKFSFEKDFLEKECKNNTLYSYKLDEFYTINDIEQYNDVIKKLNKRELI
ncbi:MAG: nucleotidyltransferase family protein [Candidatus Micrarchaeia archaeon]